MYTKKSNIKTNNCSLTGHYLDVKKAMVIRFNSSPYLAHIPDTANYMYYYIIIL